MRVLLRKLIRYHGEVPFEIKLRAYDIIKLFNGYIAWDKDGTCHIFPCKPILRKRSGHWEPQYRLGTFQCEEIKFTDVKYSYSDWDKVLIFNDKAPDNLSDAKMSLLKPTRRIHRWLS